VQQVLGRSVGIVADVDVVLIEAEQRLVAEAGATSATGIGRVEEIVEDATILADHGDIEVRVQAIGIDAQDGEEEIPLGCETSLQAAPCD